MEVFYENRFKRIRKTHQTYPKRARSDTGKCLLKKAGVSQHYIYEIEAGRKAMSIHSFASLTTALDVSADYLYW